MKFYKDKNWLAKKYLTEELSPYQIAKLCGCCKTTIQNWLNKFNLPIRSHGEAVHMGMANHCNLSEEAKQF